MSLVPIGQCLFVARNAGSVVVDEPGIRSGRRHELHLFPLGSSYPSARGSLYLENEFSSLIVLLRRLLSVGRVVSVHIPIILLFSLRHH